MDLGGSLGLEVFVAGGSGGLLLDPGKGGWAWLLLGDGGGLDEGKGGFALGVDGAGGLELEGVERVGGLECGKGGLAPALPGRGGGG